MGQVTRYSLAECLYLKVTHEVTVMLALGLWFHLKTRMGEDPLPSSLTWLLGKDIHSLPHEPHDMAIGVPQNDQWKE